MLLFPRVLLSPWDAAHYPPLVNDGWCDTVVHTFNWTFFSSVQCYGSNEESFRGIDALLQHIKHGQHRVQLGYLHLYCIGVSYGAGKVSYVLLHTHQDISTSTGIITPRDVAALDGVCAALHQTHTHSLHITCDYGEEKQQPSFCYNKHRLH